MDNLSDDVLLCAHTHIPSIKEYKNKLLINPGSVGKPKIGTPDSTYCIIDIDNNGKITPQIHQINYDVNKIVKDKFTVAQKISQIKDVLLSKKEFNKTITKSG